MDHLTPRSDRVDDAVRSAADRRVARAEGIALVAVGYDGSGASEEAVRWADSLARRTGSALRVVWAWKIRDVWDTAVAEDHHAVSPPMRELESVARRRLAEVVARLLGSDAPHVELHLRQGPDSADILLHAAADADLLVVGSRGRGRAASAVLGSVSARCVHESPVPVLVIPHRMVRAEVDDPDLVAAAPGAGDDETSRG
jgi:nucleotide-binding universal stress UspA family protein